MAAENVGVPEAEVIQNGQFSRVDRYGHFRLNGLARKISYIQWTKVLDFFLNFVKIMEKNQFLCMKMFNNSSS